MSSALSHRSGFSALPAVLLWVSVFSCGCHSWQKSQHSAADLYAVGQLEDSRAALEVGLEHRAADEPLLLLERSILDLAEGRPDAAETTLRRSRRVVEHLTQTDAGETAAATVTDDRAVAWSGRPFERHMLLNLLTVSSLLNGGDDAFAYSLQLTEVCAAERHQAADDGLSADAASTQVITVSHAGPAAPDWTALPQNEVLCLSTWLRAVVQSEIPLQWEECERSLNDLAAFNPDFAPQGPLAGTFGTRCPKGQGGVQVLLLLGRSPEWVPERVMPTTAALLIADRILSATGKHSLPPTISAVKVGRPEPFVLPMAAARLQCRLTDGQGKIVDAPRTTLVDLNRVAAADYEAGRDEAIARAVVRRVIKKGAIVAAKQVTGTTRNTAADLAVNVAGVAWEALEQADIRSWQTLPARIETAGVTVPEGEWTLQIHFGDGQSRAVPVRVQNGRNTVVVCLLPGDSLTGRVLVGAADQGVF